MKNSSLDFQTPIEVCNYICKKYIDTSINNLNILEPTKSSGNFVKILNNYGTVTAPEEFYSYYEKNKDKKFDYIIGNPPFTPMKQGYDILFKCMELSDRIIFIMPWLTLINGERRATKLKEFGLKSVEHLPRKIFKGSRVQCCIICLEKGYTNTTELLFY